MPRLQLKQLLGFNGVALGILAFVLVGVVCLACIGFGIYQTATGDLNDGGSGEVLTVLGLYFSVPYILILGAFIYAVFDFRVLKRGAHFWTRNTTLGLVVLLFLLQQAFSDVYIVLLHGYGALGVLAADFVVLVMFFVWQLCPNTCVAYVVLFGIKMGLVWGRAYTFATEAVFGPSGFAAMLFITIPIIQLTLFSPALESEGISQAFVARFNIAMTHLLHSLDIISFFSFCFRPLEGGGIAALRPVPVPLRWTMLVLSLVAFAANNLGVPFLFFRSRFRRIELPARAGAAGTDGTIVQSTQSSVSHRDFHLLANSSGLGNDSFHPQGGDHLADSPHRGVVGGSGFRDSLSVQRGGDQGKEASAAAGGTAAEVNEHEQMLTFLLVMLMAVDVPFLATRFALWGARVERMDVFAAKNIKSCVDVIMLLTRTREN